MKTNLPTQRPDVWKPATEADRAAALVSLAALPSRQTSSEKLDRAAYHIALDGVTRYGLTVAVQAILRGALGHAFFPSPPELRMQCDQAMQWHEREAERIRRRQRENAEWQRIHGDWRPPTEAEKARTSAVYAKFCEAYEKPAHESPKLDPELVAKVPDNPKLLARQRMGVRE